MEPAPLEARQKLTLKEEQTLGVHTSPRLPLSGRLEKTGKQTLSQSDGQSAVTSVKHSSAA